MRTKDVVYVTPFAKEYTAMSAHGSPFHRMVHKKLREVFGEPDNSLGRDDHWSLRVSPLRPAINVLVNGTGDTPAVWVFDPHSVTDGVMRQLIESDADLTDVIRKIQERLKLAAGPNPRKSG